MLKINGTSREVTLAVLATILVVLVSCTRKNTKENVEESGSEATSNVERKAEVPDPRGTYTDAEGGLSMTFLPGGAFRQSMLGESSRGTWRRSGDEIEVTYSDGYSTDVRLFDGYVVFNGLRLSK